MDDDVAFPRVVVETNRRHQRPATRRPVARPHVNVPRVQTTRAMIPIAPVCERCDSGAAVRAGEAGILRFLADGPRLRELKELQLRGRGSVRFSPKVPG
jgi:hypothetical protein